MIKHLRNIRQSLMMENQTGKYFKYAIGEIILVVIGILIALQINNWNENRKLEIQREELISNLIEDFTAVSEEIDFAIKSQENGLERMNSFYKIIENREQVISVDSLKRMASVFFAEDNFKPNISSYNEAVSNGNLKLLKSRQLTEHLDGFFEAVDSYGQIYRFGGESFFHGPVWELRKRLGSIKAINDGKNSFTEVPHTKFTYDEFVAVVNEPIATATLENGYVIKRNLTNHLIEMKASCVSILTILNELGNKI